MGSQVAAVSGSCQRGSGTRQANNGGKKKPKLTSHVGELLATALEVIAVLGLDGVLDGRRHWVVGTQDGALDKLDLTCHTTLEATGSTSAGLLSLPPCFG